MTVPTTDLLPGPDPLYHRIRKTIRARVTQGVWKNGQMLPSRRRLCVEFGTTQVTMDKAIQGLVQEGLLRSSRGSGTFVAEAITSQKALRIGVVIKRDDSSETLEAHWDDNFYFGPLFRGIRSGFVGQDVEVIYAHLQRGGYEHYCREKSLDGIILVLPPLDDLSALHGLSGSGIPFVATGFSTHNGADATLPCVDVDNVDGAVKAVRHLLELGHSRIAIVNLALSQSNHHDRLEGYRTALAEAGMGIDPHDLVLAPTYNATQFEPLIEAWLTQAESRGVLPTAIFACDYMMSLATLRVLRAHKIRVPEDMSLISFDDPLSAPHLSPPLTTIRQPVNQLGQVAAQRLLQELQKGENLYPTQGLIVLPTELIVRESTAPPRDSGSSL